MVEESKTPDSDFVQMNDGKGPGLRKWSRHHPLEDPNLSQEKNTATSASPSPSTAHRKRHDAAASTTCTSRSNVHSRLAHVCKKDHRMLTMPDEYTTENSYKKGDSDYVPPAAVGAVIANGATDLKNCIGDS